MKCFKLLIVLFFLSGLNQAAAQEPSFEKGELIIQIDAAHNVHELIRTYQAESMVVVENVQMLSEIANVYLIVFEDKEIDLEQAKSKLNQYKAVNLVQKNHHISRRETIPTDTLLNQQWFHKNTGQTGGTVDADIDTPDAWDITTGGLTTHNDTIVVCVIEGGGVDIFHTDLIDNIWHNYAEIPDNGIDDDNNGYVDDFDGWNVSTLNDQVGAGPHGTRVAGMIGAKGNNTTGVSGVNWDVKMMIIKGQNANNEATVIAAYDYPLTMRKMYNDSYGQEGAFVVVTNASWGVDNGNAADFPIWCAMYDTLGAYGILNVGATTNNNLNVEVSGDMPTTCNSPYLIGVTMSDHDDNRANSGYGPAHVDLAAPGSSVLLPIPGDFYGTANGTSFATPCVAGAIALAYSAPCPDFIANSKVSPANAALEMKNFVLSSVDPVASLSTEVGTGGRLNVQSLIDSLMDNCNTAACSAPYYVRLDSLTDTTATIVWDGFSADYALYLQEGSNPEIEISLSNQDTLIIDTLNPCTYYTVKVKGVCGSDTSAFSPTFNFTTDGCCNNPSLMLNDASEDEITIEWSPILYATAYDVRYRKQGDVSWINTFVDTVSPVLLTGLDTCVAYEFQIKTLCTDSTHGFSASHIFSTKGCGACYEVDYCEVLGANDNLEWIDSVVVNGLVSKTGQDNGWLQSDWIIGTFQAGETFTIQLAPGYSSTIFNERFSVWIDLNHDGIWDSNEKLLSNVITTTSVVADITIPLGTSSGVTKMRIGMNGQFSPEACPPGTSFYGEYEDYCVYIGEDASIPKQKQDISIYPNPVNEKLIISSNIPIKSASIYSIDGQLALSLDQNLSEINTSTLTPGLYVLHLQTDNETSVLKFVKQ